LQSKSKLMRRINKEKCNQTK